LKQEASISNSASSSAKADDPVITDVAIPSLTSVLLDTRLRGYDGEYGRDGLKIF
jgi:hypothetical protein